MNNEENGVSLEREDISSTSTGSTLQRTTLSETDPEDTNSAAPIATETLQCAKAIEQTVDADGFSSTSVDHEPRTDEAASSAVVNSVSVKKP